MDRIRVKIVLTIDWIEQHTKQLEALLRQGTEESKSTLNILRKRYAECLLEVLLAIDTFRQVQREMKRTEVVAEEILPSYSTVRVVHILVTFMHKETTSLTIVWAYNIREHLAQLRRVSEQLLKYEKS